MPLWSAEQPQRGCRRLCALRTFAVPMDKGGMLMWIYEKKLQFPVNITCPDAKAAAVIISQLGGPDGEMAAALRYLSQ